MIPTYKGTALDDAGAYGVARNMPTSVIALVGPVKCGKTTLIAGIHQSFLYGPVDQYAFRSSRTLSGFEEKCFNSRIASGAEKATMPRTSRRVGREFYELSLRRKGHGSLHQVLLLDMSGEFYESAMNSRADAEQLTFLRNAGRVSMLLDGARLGNGRLREKVYTDAKMMLRRFEESGCIDAETPLQFVISKLDRLSASAEPDAVNAALEEIRNRFPKESQRKNFSLMGVAASPLPATPFPMRFGMPALFKSWVEIPERPLADYPKIEVASDRVAGRLAVAWMPERYQ
jgi:hypothetical protein